MTVTSKQLGDVIIAANAQGENRHIGEMKTFADFPCAFLIDKDGAEISWAAHLCRIATDAEALTYWKDRAKALDTGAMLPNSKRFVVVGQEVFHARDVSLLLADLTTQHDRATELAADVGRLQRMLADTERMNRNLINANTQLSELLFGPGEMSSATFSGMVDRIVDQSHGVNCDVCPLCGGPDEWPTREDERACVEAFCQRLLAGYSATHVASAADDASADAVAGSAAGRPG